MTTTAYEATHAELLQHLAELMPRPFLVITLRGSDPVMQVQVRSEDDFDEWLRLGIFGPSSASEYEHSGLYWRQVEALADWHGFRIRLIRCEQAEVTA